MPLYVLGLNHKTAPVAVRERLSVSAEAMGAALNQLKTRPGVTGTVIVSTCNRTEVYAESDSPTPLIAAFEGAQLESSPVSRGFDWASHVYEHSDERAVAHAFRVAAGLDSMVLGEPQILGQVKQAVAASREARALSPTLDRMFQATFAAAKAVRSETAIGEASVSLAAAGVKVAERIFDTVSAQRLLLVGVGEMVELAAAHFGKQSPSTVTIVNRTPANARALASRMNARVEPLAALPDLLAHHDIVVTGTASTLPVIGKGMVERAIAKRRSPMLFIDFAVPRDVEAEVGQLDDVFVFTVDDLGKLVQQGQARRTDAANAAEAIVDQHVKNFSRWLASRESASLIVTLRKRGEEYRSAELDRARKLLASGVAADAVLDTLSRSLTNKFLHHPTQALSRADPGRQSELARAIDHLYPADEASPNGDAHGLTDAVQRP